MVSFKKKDIKEGAIGDRIRQAREARGESIEAVERATGIPKKYIEAMEENAFARLPDIVYAKNFVRTLATRYGLDPVALSEGLVREMSVAGGRGVFGADRPVTFVNGKRLAMTPRVAKRAVIAIVLLGLVSYFGMAVYSILRPPRIVVASPQNNAVLHDEEVMLEGKTEPETSLTINNEVVSVEADGAFKKTLRLPEGVSNLRIAGKKKHSKENEIFLRVVVEMPQTTSASSTVSATGTKAH